MICIYMNNRRVDFLTPIFNGDKVFETRSRRTLNRYTNQIIGIVETGRRDRKRCLRGFCVLGEPMLCDDVGTFRGLYNLHRVPAGSQYDIKPGGKKWLYPIRIVSELEVPVEITNVKQRFGRVACEI